jgi:hypothetical protein
VAADADAEPPVEDVRVPTPWERVAGWWVYWVGAPRSYRLTRWLLLRLLGIVFTAAFAGIVFQGLPLLGSHGLLPVHHYIGELRASGVGFVQEPTVFFFADSDGAFQTFAAIGLVLSIALALGYANLPSMLVLWFLYGSFERVGQTWFAFGWDIQIQETALLCAFLVHPWDPRPLASRAPPVTAIVLLRWLAFRIYLGAGLIKARGDVCWTDLTCLDYHFETQPLPNPISPLFHHMPHWVHAAGVVGNHMVELVMPWFAFGPRPLRLVAGCAMIAFQATLVASGNLAFLNWLTLVPLIALLDDDFVTRLAPRHVRAWLGRRLARGGAPARLPHRVACYLLAAVFVLHSCGPIENLASKHQAMNRSYDRLSLENTYGAFGSVDEVRHELVIEGTLDADPAHATWHAYELPCKPGALDRRPCMLGPYHLRLDWLIWFAAMTDEIREPWLIHMVWKLLDGDPGIRGLLAVDPFHGSPPKWVRIQRFVYHLAPYSADTWWTRDSETPYLEPVSLDTPGLRELITNRFGWSD